MPEDTNTETTALENEMRGLVEKYVVPEVGKAREAAEKVQEIHKDLMSKWERGSAPDDQAVKDLEAEKAERETEMQEMRHQIRRLQLDLKNEVAAQPRSEAATNFRGAFFKDIEKVRHAVDQYGNLGNAMQKRAIDTSLISSAGALNADQENQFLDWLVEKQLTLNRVQVRPMRSPDSDLDEILIGDEKLRAATEGQAPTVADSITFGKRSLATKETIWAEDLTRSFLEDNIERANAEDHIMRDLATAFGNNHNNLFWRGDEADSSPFLGINDGIIKIAKNDASVVDYDASSDTTVEQVLGGLLKALSFDFAMQPDLTFFIPYKSVLFYLDELTDRGTVFADQVVLNGLAAARYFGLPVIGEPHLNKAGQDEALLTFARNLVWGVQRGITSESEWNARKRVVEVTITARTDQNYAKSAAVVLADTIASTLR